VGAVVEGAGHVIVRAFVPVMVLTVAVIVAVPAVAGAVYNAASVPPLLVAEVGVICPALALNDTAVLLAGAPPFAVITMTNGMVPPQFSELPAELTVTDAGNAIC
jgi:hypothetical protein